MTRPKVDMPYEHFVDLVLEAKELGAGLISLFGYGEPLLDKTIVDKIRFCTDQGLESFITTNASMLDTDTSNELVKAGLSRIRFSVHAMTNKSYNAVHVGLSGATAFRNIFNFIAISRKRCKIYVTCIPFHDETVEQFRYFWEKSVDFMEVWRPHNWAGGREYRQSIGAERTMCKRAFTGPIQILADGKMVVCCFDYNGRLVVGDTYDQSMMDILLWSSRLKDLRRRHEQNDLAGLICDSCDQRFVYPESPLLYSSMQQDKALNKTFATKTALEV